MQIYLINHLFIFKVEVFTLVTLKIVLYVTWRSLVEIYRVLEVGHLLPASTEWKV